MSILMVYLQKHFMQGNNRTINTLSSDEYCKQGSVPTGKLYFCQIVMERAAFTWQSQFFGRKTVSGL